LQSPVKKLHFPGSGNTRKAITLRQGYSANELSNAADVWFLEQEIAEAKSSGAEVVELRLDYLEDLSLEDPLPALEKLLGSCKTQRIPAIVTFRPDWEG